MSESEPVFVTLDPNPNFARPREVGPWKISNSEINTFKDCRRKWWLSYYRGLSPKGSSLVGALPLGTRLHAALEAFYTVPDTDLLVKHKELLDADRMAMEEAGQDPSDLDSEGDLGRIMLEGYLDWLEETGADSEWEVVTAEQTVSTLLFDGKVELRGKIDMKVRRKEDGTIFTLDHKTAKAPDLLATMAYMDEQFLTYHLLEMLQEENEFRCDGGIYNILKKVKRTASAKPPFYERVEVRHNAEYLKNFWTRVHGEIQDMLDVRDKLDAGVDHRFAAYPRPNNDCRWKCNHFSLCPLLDDGSAAEHMIAIAYQVSDPNARYENKDGNL